MFIRITSGELLSIASTCPYLIPPDSCFCGRCSCQIELLFPSTSRCKSFLEYSWTDCAFLDLSELKTLMTRKSVKQEKPGVEGEEEVTMPSSIRPKRKSRAELPERDADMTDAPTVSVSSFAAMPTPSSFAADSGIETPIDGLRRESTAGEPESIHNTFTQKAY